MSLMNDIGSSVIESELTESGEFGSRRISSRDTCRSWICRRCDVRRSI